MPLRYKILPEHRLLFGIFHGTLTPVEFQDNIDAVSMDPEFEPDFDRLAIYHDDLDLSLFGLDDIVAIKDHMIDAYFGGTPPDASHAPAYRVAAVSEPSINETMLKLYGATLTSSMLSRVTVKTFRTLDKALVWLDRETLMETFREPSWRAFIEDEN